MRKSTIAVLLIVTLIFLAANLTDANAMLGGKLENARIENMHYSTRVIGQINQQQAGSRGTNDPSTIRFLILTITADAPATQELLFARDFVLYYTNNGETRASCLGIAAVDSKLHSNTFYLTDIFNEPGIKIQGPRVSFALLFFVENNVNSFTLYRIGTDNPIQFNPGTRKLSIFLTTNSLNSSELAEIERLTADSGCSVATSMELSDNTEGITIFYAPKAEGAAREISQRLMTKFNHEPRIQESSLITSYDVIIWIGRGSKMKNISF